MSLSHRKHMPSVRLAMTPFPHSIDVGAAAGRAREMMEEHRIRHLPVTRDGEIHGIISERDLRLVLRPGAAPTEVRVADACQEDLYCVPDDTPLDIVLTTMAERHIGSAVVRRGDHLAGILTVTDVCRHFAEVLRAQYPGDGTPPEDDGPPASAA